LTKRDYNPEPLLIRPSVDDDREALLDELERREARLRFARNIRTLWSERTFLFRLAFCGFVLVFLVSWLISNEYVSTTRLMPPDSQASTSTLAMAAAAMSSKSGGLGELAGDILGMSTSSDQFVALLTSRTAQDRIIEQFDLKKVYGKSEMQKTRKELASRTAISVDRKSQVITITVMDHDRKRAALIAGAYVDVLDHLVSELSTGSARRERIFLEGRIQAVRADLEDAEREFSQFASKNGTIDIKEQGRAMVEAAATLQGRLMSAQSELQGLKAVYADNNVRVRAVQARIDELQRQLDKFGGKGEGTVSADSSAADLYPSIRKLPLLGVTYADLFRRTKVQETVYEALTREYELSKVQEAKEIPTVKVLDSPDIPERKSYPPRLLFSMAGGGIALLGGIVFLLLSKSWSERDPQDVGKVLVSEIWIDLKEKRLLTAGNGASNGTGEPAESHTRRGFFAFLGLRNGTASSAAEKSEEESKQEHN